tara:strand:- start:497 stop:835 length:339 start_codon:yes stop_codon:yes gene_type:complete
MDSFLKKFAWVSLGAIPAALLRWQINETFIVNIIGCFLLGFINGLNISKRYKLIFGFGFCGSLTTFSGWSFQLLQFFARGSYKLFFFNSILVLLIGLFSLGLGHLLSKKIKA